MAPGSPDPLVLAGEFPAADRDQWMALVEGVLKGRPFDKVLVNHLPGGIDIQPLYTALDVAPGDAPLGLPGVAPFVRGATAARPGWDVRQRHIAVAVDAPNDAVLADLERGATSLWVRNVDLSLDALLRDVYLDMVGIVLDPGADASAALAEITELWHSRDIAVPDRRGGLGADPIAHGAGLDGLATMAQGAVASYPNFRVLTVDGTIWHDGGGSDVDELAFTLASGVAYLRHLTEHAGLDLPTANSQIEFRFAATADQFATIVKLRAARRLWARVTELSGAAQAQVQHAVTSAAMMTTRDPWVNMLRTTVACFGAAVGGADAITVAPFDAAVGRSDAFGRRVARNTQALLLDEANLARVNDPGGGSWYVEHLTDQLAKAAWDAFRDVERAGGMQAALDRGTVRARLDATWQQRATAIARRTEPITGVSEFPDIAEVPVQRPPHPPEPPRAVPMRRYAEAFEALRDRADAAPARPTVFLANLGPVAVHTARATFAKNFFEAGGIATIGNDGFSSPVEVEQAFAESGATLACICSSDAVYDERADAVALALTTAGARRVLLAGRRDTDGVDDTIFTGCDAQAVLERALAAALDEGAHQ
jgi:methylmalonyl-CoA mutase